MKYLVVQDWLVQLTARWCYARNAIVTISTCMLMAEILSTSKKQQEIHDLIKLSPQGISAKDIAEKLGKNLNTTKNLIQKLKKDNYIDITSTGKYIATTKPADQELQATRDALSEKEEEE